MVAFFICCLLQLMGDFLHFLKAVQGLFVWQNGKMVLKSNSLDYWGE